MTKVGDVKIIRFTADDLGTACACIEVTDKYIIVEHPTTKTKYFGIEGANMCCFGATLDEAEATRRIHEKL